MIGDDVDQSEVSQRLNFVNALYVWSNGRHNPAALEAALDVIPPGVITGWVVVYLTYDDDGAFHKAHWTNHRLGLLWQIHKARRELNLAFTIIDIETVEVCAVLKDGQW